MTTEQRWFSVGAPGYDVADIQARVVRRMHERTPGGLVERQPATGFAAVREALAALEDPLEDLAVQVSVRDERLPIGNSLWNRMKVPFHQLSALYVNDLAGRQTVINVGLADVLDELIDRLETTAQERDREIEALKGEIARLNEQVARLSTR